MTRQLSLENDRDVSSNRRKMFPGHANEVGCMRCFVYKGSNFLLSAAGEDRNVSGTNTMSKQTDYNISN